MSTHLKFVSEGMDKEERGDCSPGAVILHNCQCVYLEHRRCHPRNGTTDRLVVDPDLVLERVCAQSGGDRSGDGHRGEAKDHTLGVAGYPFSMPSSVLLQGIPKRHGCHGLHRWLTCAVLAKAKKSG